MSDYDPSLNRPRIYLLDRVYAESTAEHVAFRWPSIVEANDLGLIISPQGSIWWHVASGHEGSGLVMVTRQRWWVPPSGWARTRLAREIDHDKQEYVAR